MLLLLLSAPVKSWDCRRVFAFLIAFVALSSTKRIRVLMNNWFIILNVFDGFLLCIVFYRLNCHGATQFVKLMMERLWRSLSVWKSFIEKWKILPTFHHLINWSDCFWIMLTNDCRSVLKSFCELMLFTLFSLLALHCYGFDTLQLYLFFYF